MTPVQSGDVHWANNTRVGIQTIKDIVEVGIRRYIFYNVEVLPEKTQVRKKVA